MDPKNPVSIEIWHYYNGPQKIAFDEAVNEFNETVGLEQGIIVEAFNQGNISQLIENVLNAANKKVGAGDVPDIYAAYPDTAYQVDKLGLVASLDQYLTEEELSAYFPGYLEEGRFDEQGNLKIFPIAKSTEIMMLNKTDWDKFAAATGASLDTLKTMEGVTETAKSYYEWSDGKAFFGRDAMANYFVVGCKQLGVDIFSVKNGTVSVNLDEAVMRKLWDNYYVPYVNGYFAAYRKFRSDDVWNGDIIALVGSTSGAAYFPDKITVNDVDKYPIEGIALPAPVFADGSAYAVQQGAGMVVSKSTPEKEYAATVFLKWFTETERNIAFSVGSGYLPVKKEAANIKLVEKAWAESEDSSVTDALKISLPVAIEVINTHELYTTKAFEGGTDARNILEYSLPDLANADLKQIDEMVKNGISRAEAVAQFTTDKHFQEWYQGLQEALAIYNSK